MAGPPPSLGGSPSKPRMVTHLKEVFYWLGIWHLHISQKTNTRWQLPRMVPYHFLDGQPPAARFVSISPNLALLGPVWPCLRLLGPVWPIWPRLTLFGPVCFVHLPLFVPIWYPLFTWFNPILQPFEPFKPCFALFNSVWQCLALCGPTWPNSTPLIPFNLI